MAFYLCYVVGAMNDHPFVAFGCRPGMGRSQSARDFRAHYSCRNQLSSGRPMMFKNDLQASKALISGCARPLPEIAR
jgi:hypothetical protein